ncbi:MAG TPA: tetrahydrofolate dehydrogenase/cyclohydrolase catalytic domain-containing protein [Povalibacter sp.]|uniref:bifunctional 5,10-methylenetetrahydrofolate dehydrogenase/5,10-methenyltetrahydrofolate cyclohydrolase n=1 Tax=Povalibacter sp. TaxID=1962978 RepID=UPI002C636A87|nr:tetrahydrofolate dehydrogenase/cyclohydrolase catalytic domain-containing protein [Povalibacter sp.]HMN47455.1 tetrahydrofolate dehydrogenase/cyclohydrolase catalytic domain-containing protein [Povalibacter sp.]
MTARIIDGRAIAAKLRAEYHVRVDELKARHGITPGLAVILVGDSAASRSYVSGKIKACREAGIHSELIELPTSVGEEELLARIDELNVDPAIHGILVQLPLPPHIRVASVIEAISVEKDVDGFHLYNMGGLVTGSTVFSPCTPYGVQKMLEHENIRIEGQNVVVVGASNIVGKPTALMLMQQEATVSICHVKTRDLGHYTLLADILVVAAGVPNLIVPQIVRTGAVVIDVGFNRLPDGRIVGDVDFEGVKEKASYITPVPGGVGQLTVTMLLHNTIVSAERFATATTSGFRR